MRGRTAPPLSPVGKPGVAMVDPSLLFEQLLNGVQLGILLFLLASGLTLVFGIMDLMNLAHGSLYMIGAYVAAKVTILANSFLLGVAVALPATLLLGVALELLVFRRLYARGHLDQVLATFGMILFFNELVRLIWGPAGVSVPLPEILRGHIDLFGLPYPTYRVLVILVGLGVAAFLYWLVVKTRVGMLIRAGASRREMVGALGVDVARLFTIVFGIGAALAALAGVMAGPIFSVTVGMGESVLILTLVVIVVGGIGSIRGAFVGALLIGVTETMGRAFLSEIFLLFMSRDGANTAGPAVASMLVYIIMAVVLVFRPQGLFPARTG
jgi:branched-chain amino acid transport system permease protein